MSEASMLWLFRQPAKKCKYLAQRCWFQPAAFRLFISPFTVMGIARLIFFLYQTLGRDFFLFSGQLSALID